MAEFCKNMDPSIYLAFDNVLQDLLDDAKDPGADPVAAKAMKTFDLMDKVEVFLKKLKIFSEKMSHLSFAFSF